MHSNLRILNIWKTDTLGNLILYLKNKHTVYLITSSLYALFNSPHNISSFSLYHLHIWQVSLSLTPQLGWIIWIKKTSLPFYDLWVFPFCGWMNYPMLNPRMGPFFCRFSSQIREALDLHSSKVMKNFRNHFFQ